MQLIYSTVSLEMRHSGVSMSSTASSKNGHSPSSRSKSHQQKKRGRHETEEERQHRESMFAAYSVSPTSSIVPRTFCLTRGWRNLGAGAFAGGCIDDQR
jgi:hypothetical protein